MKKQHVSFLFFLLSTAYAGAQSSGDIIITEFMPDPVKVADGSGEWLEVYNTTTHAININNWQLKDGGSKNHRINNKAVLYIQPGSFLLLSVKADSAVNGGLHPDYVYSNFSLPNTSGKLVITDSAGVVIDSVRYANAAAGKSQNLNPAFFDGKANDDKDHWCTANRPYGLGDFGTPGNMNTGCVSSSIRQEYPFTLLSLQLIGNELIVLLPEGTEEQTWGIWNSSGQRLQYGTCPSNNKQLIITLRELSSGMYLFRLSKNGAMAKFIRL